MADYNFIVEILELHQGIESVRAHFKYDDLDRAFAQLFIQIPVKDGVFISGDELIEYLKNYIQIERGLTREWFEAEQAKLDGSKPQIQNLPDDLKQYLPVKQEFPEIKWYQEEDPPIYAFEDGQWWKKINVVNIADRSVYTQEEKIQILRVKLLEIIKNIRKHFESNGIEFNGFLIETDRESQAVITGAYTKAKDNPELTINWKAANGWVTLNSSQIIAVGDAVFAHVQKCFNTEEVIVKQIELLNEINDIVNFDYVTAWEAAFNNN